LKKGDLKGAIISRGEGAGHTKAILWLRAKALFKMGGKKGGEPIKNSLQAKERYEKFTGNGKGEERLLERRTDPLRRIRLVVLR